MTITAPIESDIRDRILDDPTVILDDREVMRALIAANERSMGGNIVDLRGIAMERLEARLDRLEDTHRSVIAAAYDNLAGMNQVHRAVLKMLDPTEFEIFLHNLTAEVAEILRVDFVRLVLESTQSEADPAVDRLGDVLQVVEPGAVDLYLTRGRDVPPRAVTLRQTLPASEGLFGADTDWIRSEALLKLDFGPGRLPGLLVMGSEDPHQFAPTQGTDLLGFFGGVFERSMRRWLS
ncbi:DUF484 family protein [Actibacterium ureilyticum]|uniref:DUF484 family protein n=1 Tax=Actibacterium ureilyticum TaxID=1590614 RepID=UPI000BAAE7F8|nr:DUF484 family protein [Actibacterium ureilyticum]